MNSCLTLGYNISNACACFLYKSAEVTKEYVILPVVADIQDVFNGKGTAKSYVVTGMATVAAVTAFIAVIALVGLVLDGVADGVEKSLAFVFRVESEEGREITQMIGALFIPFTIMMARITYSSPSSRW